MKIVSLYVLFLFAVQFTHTHVVIRSDHGTLALLANDKQNHWNTQRIKWFPKYMGDYNHISQSDSVHRAVRTGLADGKVVVL